MLNVGSPTSFPLPRFLSNFGYSLHCTSHPSGSRSRAENVFKINLEVIHNPGATLLRNRVSAGAVDNFPPLGPLPPSGGPENLRFQAVSKWFFYRSHGYEPAPRWLTAWAAKMKITPPKNRGGTGSQSSFLVVKQPLFWFPVQPHSLGK